MRAKTPGWPAPGLPTQRYATGTQQRRHESATRSPSRTRWRAPGPDSCSVRPQHGILSGFWLKWRASLGETHLPDCTHPARADPLGGGVPGLQALRFRPEPGKPVSHPGRRDPEGGGAAPEEGLHVDTMEEEPGSRYGSRPSGVIRVPPTPEIPGRRSSPGS